ncbi:MAG: integrase core domain-containing protein, partial [Planctomycetota bacterium]
DIVHIYLSPNTPPKFIITATSIDYSSLDCTHEETIQWTTDRIREKSILKTFTKLIFEFIRLIFRSKQSIVLENLALRQQLAVQKRSVKRPEIKNADRIFWAWLSRFWNDWKSALIIVKPSTVIAWHKKGFKFYWKHKSRKVGRPNIDWELIKLIRKLQKDNQTWTAQRIQGELAKLGLNICNNTVAKYMRKPKAGPKKRQRWLTFLHNHTKHIVGIDFLVVRTIFFKSIHVFVAIPHGRRKILHFAVSSNPHSQWAIQQLRETISFDETTKYVIRDNDKLFSEDFKRTIKLFGLKDTPTAPRSPWQNPNAERVMDTLRRECLDHMIILNEKHLYGVLHEYICEYYNVSRTHMSLYKDSPVHRPTQTNGKITSKPILGGLHHAYSRVA